MSSKEAPYVEQSTLLAPENQEKNAWVSISTHLLMSVISLINSRSFMLRSVRISPTSLPSLENSMMMLKS